jgi:hypothetical protein
LKSVWWLLPALALALPAAPAPAAAPSAPIGPAAAVRVAVIGDYGTATSAAAAVAALVAGWQPDLVITTGDNNYPSGAASTIDANIGQFYHAFIGNYAGAYGLGASLNRFFPSLGNHDWVAANAQPYLDYFTLPSGSPGGERYYRFTWGPLELFALDSDPHEPDGITSASPQAQWLQAGLAASDRPWQLVYMHHPPYSSGLHGSTAALQWPYAAWGVDAVLAGHDHFYERLVVDGIPYFVVGAGGATLYPFLGTLPQSRLAYSGDFGALRLQATDFSLFFQFYNRAGQLVDNVLVVGEAVDHAYLPLVSR